MSWVFFSQRFSMSDWDLPWDVEAAGIAEAEFLGDPGRWVPQSHVKGMEDLYQSDS